MNARFWMSALTLAAAALLNSAGAEEKLGYDDTPLLPDGKWKVHDSKRPQPTVITPGTASTQDAPGKAPSDAIVLFDGTDLSKWRAANGKESGWMVKDGAMVVPPKGTENGGDIWTKEEFGDCQLHIEWTSPEPPKGSSQGRGNSGVFLFGRYEVQVLDCFENKTYSDGQTAALYGQNPPLVNACRKPGEWQTYDIIITGPRFKDDKLEKPAYITVIHNGVVVHNHTEIIGASGHRTVGKYSPHGKGGIKLQDHGDPVRYRNIWIRPLKAYDEP